MTAQQRARQGHHELEALSNAWRERRRRAGHERAQRAGARPGPAEEYEEPIEIREDSLDPRWYGNAGGWG